MNNRKVIVNAGCPESQGSRNNRNRNVTMKQSQNQNTDPICGIAVDQATALSAVHEGTTFYFCGHHCRKEFLSKMAGAKPENKSGGCCCGAHAVK
jgi:YHS domain-containing protein